MSGLDDLFGAGGLQAVLQRTAPRAAVEDSPALQVARLLHIEGRARSCGGNAPWRVQAPERLWLVLEGGVDLFLVSGQDGGARSHLVRVAAGGAVIGLPACAHWHVLAVPVNGTRVVEAGWSELMAVPAAREAVAELVEGWVSRLGGQGPDVPYGARTPAPGACGDVQIGDVIRGGTTPCWLRSEAVSVALWGEAAVPAEAGAVCVPLARGLWYRIGHARPGEVGATVSCTVSTTLQWLQQPDAAEALERFHACWLDRQIHARVEREAGAEQRLGEAASRSAVAFSAALRTLAGALRGRRALRFQHVSGDPLIAAAQAVAAHTGFELAADTSFERRVRSAGGDPLAVAHAGRFSARRVRLDGAWWRDDQGALLAFRGAARKPVALLPDGARRYTLFDPSTGRSVGVDEALAREIDPSAYAFYAPFPQGRLGPWRILRFGLTGAGRDLGWILGMILATGLFSLATPVVTGWIMDPIIPEAQLDRLGLMVLALALAGLGMTLFGLVQSIALLRTEGRMTHVVQAAVWDRLLRLPAAFFRRFTAGDLVNRAQGIDAMRALLASSVVAGVLHAVSGLFSMGLMVYYDWRLAFTTLAVALVYGLLTVLVARRILGHLRELQQLQGRLQGRVFQLLNAIAKLRVAGAEGRAFAQWAIPYARLQAISFDQRNLNNLLVVAKSAFGFIALLSVLLVIGWQGHALEAFYETPERWAQLSGTDLKQVMPTARFVAFHVAFGQFMAVVFGLTQSFIGLLSVRPLYERVTPILDAEPEVEPGSQDPGEVHGHIEVADVHYRYGPDLPWVLRGLSFHVEPGQFVALVGPSGAGKSSLVRLLLGFDVPQSGSILLDGKDVATLDKQAMRRRFGVVLQNGRVLAGTIFHNIAAGADVTLDQAWEAARLAGLEKDIESMPMGMQTFLGEGGGTLSGGQRQRLMIARAVVRRPRLLIFDEATSALDNETQRVVQEGIETLNCTRIVVAHRLSTIVNADCIHAIDRGRVVESGTYDELLARNGFFAALARRQIV